MANDNVTLPATGTGTADVPVATRKVTYSGDANQNAQMVGIGIFAGSDDAKTVTDVAATESAAFPTRDIGVGAGASSQVTITNSSANIIAARAGRRCVCILNLQTVSVFVDASGGTAATTHFELQPGCSLTLTSAIAVTGITSAAYTASGNAKVQVIELY